jgi:hypothetical protein
VRDVECSLAVVPQLARHVVHVMGKWKHELAPEVFKQTARKVLVPSVRDGACGPATHPWSCYSSRTRLRRRRPSMRRARYWCSMKIFGEKRASMSSAIWAPTWRRCAKRRPRWTAAAPPAPRRPRGRASLRASLAVDGRGLMRLRPRRTSLTRTPRCERRHPSCTTRPPLTCACASVFMARQRRPRPTWLSPAHHRAYAYARACHASLAPLLDDGAARLVVLLL